jgi:hypothetical protein
VSKFANGYGRSYCGGKTLLANTTIASGPAAIENGRTG